MLPITSLYLSLLSFFFLYLTYRVIKIRRSQKINIGDGGHSPLLMASRAHSNFVEYSLIAILLLGFSEIQGAPSWVIHILGILLLAGRILHGLGMLAEPQIFKWRKIGMVMTLTMIGLTALSLLAHSIL